jgi:Tfp pilus assembly protein FimT
MYENEKQNQFGRSMIEMLGVLAVVAALTIGGVIAFRQAMNKNRSNTLVDGITHTVNNVKTLFIKQDQYEELSTDEAYELGIVPDTFKHEADKITHAYGGEVKIQAKTTSDGQTYYAVAVKGLPRDVAMHIATQDWGGSGDLVSVNLNDGNEEEEEGED